MRNNINKRILLFLLAFSLSASASGCSRKNKIEEINRILKSSSFYQEDNYMGKNEEFYGKFYETYLNNFMKYMSDEEYEDFRLLVLYVENMEDNVYISIADRLTKIQAEPQQTGFWFYYAFNSTLVSEELYPIVLFSDEISRTVNTIKSLVNDDEAFYKAMFSKDLSKVIKLICKSTHCKDEDMVRQMIIDFDNYYTLIMHDGESQLYASKINEYLDVLIKSKKDAEPEFASSFYGRMLDEENLSIIHSLVGDTAKITIKDVNGEDLSFDITDEYFYASDMELFEVKYGMVNDKIKEALEGKDSGWMDLICLLLSPDCTLENTGNVEAIRSEIYNDLSDYFVSLDDFIEFMLGMINLSPSSQKRYMDIFKARLKENGIDMRDYLNYQCLVNLYYDNQVGSYSFDSADYDEVSIKDLPVEEALYYASYRSHNTLLSRIDVRESFLEIEEILMENQMGIDFVINRFVNINWKDAPISFSNCLFAQVVSKTVPLRSINKDGITVNYFMAPVGFNDGRLVEVYKNLSGEDVVKSIEGMDDIIIDPVTKEKRKIVVVSVGDDTDVPKVARFAKDILVSKNELGVKNKSDVKGLGLK